LTNDRDHRFFNRLQSINRLSAFKSIVLFFQSIFSRFSTGFTIDQSTVYQSTKSFTFRPYRTVGKLCGPPSDQNYTTLILTRTHAII